MTDVARLDRAAVDDVPLLDHADAKAGQIVIAGGVEVGQDRGFAAQQRAIALDAAVGDAFDDLLQQLRIVLGHGHVIEEEQRLRPAAEGVVDAHRHEIDAHRVVHAHRDGHFELRAHAVGAGDQHRLLIISGEQPAGEIELEKAGEPVFEGDHAGRKRSGKLPRQAGHRLAIDLEIHTGIFIGYFGHVVGETRALGGEAPAEPLRNSWSDHGKLWLGRSLALRLMSLT